MSRTYHETNGYVIPGNPVSDNVESQGTRRRIAMFINSDGMDTDVSYDWEVLVLDENEPAPIGAVAMVSKEYGLRWVVPLRCFGEISSGLIEASKR